MPPSTGLRPRPSAILLARPNMRLSELAATATPARFAPSSIGCYTSPAPCSKIELCSTLPSRKRKPQLGDSQRAHCAVEELSPTLVSAEREVESRRRQEAKPTFIGPLLHPATLGCRHDA